VIWRPSLSAVPCGLGHAVAIVGVHLLAALDRLCLLQRIQACPVVLPQDQEVVVHALGGQVHPDVGHHRIGAVPMPSWYSRATIAWENLSA
jgi:hypothetical protein